MSEPTATEPLGFALQHLAVFNWGIDMRLFWGFQRLSEPLVYVAVSDNGVLLAPHPVPQCVTQDKLRVEATTLTTVDDLRQMLHYRIFTVTVKANALYRKMLSLVQDVPVIVEIYCAGHWVVGHFEEQPFGLCFVLKRAVPIRLQIPLHYVSQLAYPQDGPFMDGLPWLYLYLAEPPSDDDPHYT